MRHFLNDTAYIASALDEHLEESLVRDDTDNVIETLLVNRQTRIHLTAEKLLYIVDRGVDLDADDLDTRNEYLIDSYLVEFESTFDEFALLFLDNALFLDLVDKVEIFETETRTIVSKVDEKKADNAMPAGGININMNNNQTMQTPQVMLANGTVAVNKLVYCLLCFFLGGIGAHKFYAHKTGSGILYLLFCWTFIPTLVSFVEGIRYFFMPVDDFYEQYYR